MKTARGGSKLVAIITDPVESAKEAGLRYTTDAKPGIARERAGKGFRYIGPDGETVRNPETLRRIRSLVIPPAWKDVWITTDPRGHLQATGRDARGRKQSRYHPRWRAVRDETKYERMLLFGTALRRIRERVEEHLGLPGLPREKVLATVVRLMDSTLIRVGNDEYAKENKSYGLTTMRRKHVKVNGSQLVFRFRGKSGVLHEVGVQDRRLARIVRRCQELPGYELFEYLDAEGQTRAIDSMDVNDYLREISGGEFTAKDFRTWAGTVLTSMTLRQFEGFESETQAKKNVVQAIKDVARRLGNTPAVCRKCYVHPGVLECYMTGLLTPAAKRKADERSEQERQGANHAWLSAEEEETLRREERALMQLLREHLKAGEQKTAA
ncbi:MAG TPA: DNA topoisomerase IB [Terracidiphilus sp.]|nr:DNA topoisomerase IB [Terracidiphilus sp.]